LARSGAARILPIGPAAGDQCAGIRSPRGPRASVVADRKLCFPRPRLIARGFDQEMAGSDAISWLWRTLVTGERPGSTP
jgi:hypothetical protein